MTAISFTSSLAGWGGAGTPGPRSGCLCCSPGDRIASPLAFAVEDGRGQPDLHLVPAGGRAQPHGPAAHLLLPVVLQRQRPPPGAERLPHPPTWGQAPYLPPHPRPAPPHPPASPRTAPAAP